jgi:hydrogenase small subunit
MISYCPLYDSTGTSKKLIDKALGRINSGNLKKINAIWLEATGCSGNIFSFINGENPDLLYNLTQLVNLKFNNTLMSAQGDSAYDVFLDTLSTEFILLIDGAVSTKDNGLYNVIANYKGRPITALEAVKLAGNSAKYVIAVGTCASYGGISAAKPNPALCKSVKDILNRNVIRVPGCPSHPDWVIGTLAHLVSLGMPDLDDEGRPLLFYGVTIHDNCTRRGFFDKNIFAKKLGEDGCMFKLGCRGPVTKTDCPRRKWNGYVNWPIGDNTPCIGCAQPYFPDGMEPFVKY